MVPFWNIIPAQNNRIAIRGVTFAYERKCLSDQGNDNGLLS